jgi:hypothetical protein
MLELDLVGLGAELSCVLHDFFGESSRKE